jgi:hypothetical protein
LTPEELAMWDNATPESLVTTFGALAAAQEVFERRRHLLRTAPLTRPSAWWVFYGPQELQRPSEVSGEDGIDASINAHDALNAARRRWLVESGHLEDDEFAELTREALSESPSRQEAAELLALAAATNGGNRRTGPHMPHSRDW